MTHVRRLRGAFIAFVVLLVIAIIALMIGPVAIEPGSIVASLIDKLPVISMATDLDASEEAIVWELRAPRVALAMLVGGALSIAGASYQGAFRNPLADPYLLGAAAGAGLFATVAIVLVDAQTLLPIFAFVGALVGVALAYTVGSFADATRNPANILLAGVATASFLTAIQTFLQQQNSDALPEVYTWILGHISTAGWNEVFIALPYVAVSCGVLIALAHKLDVLALGDDKAETIGINVSRLRMTVVIAASLATAAAVAVSGLIGFVGLVVPHMVRALVGHANRLVIPISFILGAAFVLGCDIVARTALAPSEIPIGVITAFIGAPFFFVLLWRSARAC